MALFARHVTLVANTAQTVTVTGTFSRLDIVNRSATATDEVFYTLRGPAPTVGGNDTGIVRAGERVTVANDGVSESTAVQLISSGTPKVSVVAS